MFRCHIIRSICINNILKYLSALSKYLRYWEEQEFLGTWFGKLILCLLTTSFKIYNHLGHCRLHPMNQPYCCVFRAVIQVFFKEAHFRNNLLDYKLLWNSPSDLFTAWNCCYLLTRRILKRFLALKDVCWHFIWKNTGFVIKTKYCFKRSVGVDSWKVKYSKN